MHFQITLTSDHAARYAWLSSVQRAQRVADEKKKKKKESLAKYKSAGVLCRAA